MICFPAIVESGVGVTVARAIELVLDVGQLGKHKVEALVDAALDVSHALCCRRLLDSSGNIAHVLGKHVSCDACAKETGHGAEHGGEDHVGGHRDAPFVAGPTRLASRWMRRIVSA